MVKPYCNMELRSAVFDVLRRHDVDENCFAEIAMITHEALKAENIDNDTSVAGCPEAKIMSYNDLYNDAVSMGYTCVLEALEHLYELKQEK